MPQKKTEYAIDCRAFRGQVLSLGELEDLMFPVYDRRSRSPLGIYSLADLFKKFS